MADNLSNGEENIKPHFLGAVVLDQMRVPIGRPDARSIIDGQQRLTTLEIFLSSFRDVCRLSPENERIAKAIDQIIFNDDPLAEEEIDRFKVWPTNIDRSAYQEIIIGGSPEIVRQKMVAKNIDNNNKIFQAYLYFYSAIVEWLDSNSGEVSNKLKSLLHVFREKIKLVVIDMDDEDDAQIIFETLNARGTPLLPSDLVKNFLFHRAQANHISLDQLYDKYWKTFDDDDDFWRGELRYGRLMRPRIDLFLQHYLTLMKNDDVQASNLFREFQILFEKNKNRGIEWHLKMLRQHADHFRNFLNMPHDSREGEFFRKLNVLDTTTIFPFLLGLYQILSEDKNLKIDKFKILDAIESFLIRRLICRLTTKNYNRLFLDLLNELKNEDDFDHQSVYRFFLKHKGDSGRWPDDEEFFKSFLGVPVYSALTRPRLRMILECLDTKAAAE